MTNQNVVSSWLIRNFYVTVLMTSSLAMLIVAIDVSRNAILAEIKINRDKGNDILTEQAAMRKMLDDKTSDRWRRTDSEKWINEFHRLNPTIKIPADE